MPATGSPSCENVGTENNKTKTKIEARKKVLLKVLEWLNKFAKKDLLNIFEFIQKKHLLKSCTKIRRIIFILFINLVILIIKT